MNQDKCRSEHAVSWLLIETKVPQNKAGGASHPTFTFVLMIMNIRVLIRKSLDHSCSSGSVLT
jgi:hypothetical protein